GVLVLAVHLEVTCYGLGGEPHAPVVRGVHLAHPGVGHDSPATEGDRAHALHAARHDHIGLAAVDLGRRDGDGLAAAPAVAVHRHARHLVGVQAHQADHAADVQALLRLGRGVAHDHIVDALAVQVRHR